MVKGKWAQGIPPRNFAWIMTDKLAVCERPGGYGDNHRKVRRQEEIIWLRENGFTCVMSIIPAPHNLHNYTEMGVIWRHRPFSQHDDPVAYLGALYPEIKEQLDAGGKLVLHGEELSDRLCGLIAGYLVWTGMVPEGPRATMIIEQITKRQIGSTGRELVSVAAELAGRSTEA